VEKLKKFGVTVNWLGKDEVPKWRKAVRPIWEKWVTENGAPAKRLFDYAMKELGEK